MEPQGIRWFNKDHRGIETEKFITHRTYGTYACEEVEAGDRQGGEGPGHMPVIESGDGECGGSWAKAGLVYINLKEQRSGELCGVQSKGHTRKRWGNHIRLHIYCDSAGCF